MEENLKFVVEPDLKKSFYLRYDENLISCLRGTFDVEGVRLIEEEILKNRGAKEEYCIQQTCRYSDEFGTYLCFYLQTKTGIVGCEGLKGCSGYITEIRLKENTLFAEEGYEN